MSLEWARKKGTKNEDEKSTRDYHSSIPGKLASIPIEFGLNLYNGIKDQREQNKQKS